MEYWYIITRPDNGYPLSVYTDYEQAKAIAQINRDRLVKISAPKDWKRIDEENWICQIQEKEEKRRKEKAGETPLPNQLTFWEI